MALVSFDRFALSGGSPIYSQIIRFIKAGIVAGTIADGDELPSRRALSALLGVNPNTIQKACRLLEEEGLHRRYGGGGGGHPGAAAGGGRPDSGAGDPADGGIPGGSRCPVGAAVG